MSDFDPSDPLSIERYSQRLIGKTLRHFVTADASAIYGGKGKLGQLVEKLYFGYKPNSVAGPDFPLAGLELKTAPLKITNGKLVSKERIVLNKINYADEVTQTFETSSFWKKNRLLLLLFYLHDSEKLAWDLLFKICRLWKYPKEDLKIIREDWEKIVGKIRDGKAHEISEGDTFYLGACTKGRTSAKSFTSQPYSEEKARSRAYSLKSRYLNFIIDDSLIQKSESILKGPLVTSVKTFEELVIEHFTPYYRQTESQIYRTLRIQPSDSKHKYYLLAKAILGVSGDRIREFEKAGVVLKSIRLRPTGKPKESMSFKQIKFDDIIQETWEKSYWYKTLTKRYFFVIFQYDDRGVLRLRKVKFWTMPARDLEIAREFWETTRSQIAAGDHDHFIKESDDCICHVRPKARDSSDKVLAPSGRLEKKMAYWLNSSYIQGIVGE
jgi:DNA mismatch repair protein MutH